MRFSLFCGITKPKLRKIGRKCKCAYILPRGGGRGAAEVRKRGGKTGPQPSVPAVCGAGRRPAQLPAAAVCDGGAQPAQRRFSSDLQRRAAACGAPADEATAQLRAFAPGRLRPARLKEPQIFPAISSAGFGCCVPGPAKPGKKTVATRGAKYNKGRHPLSCASARGLRPKSCVRERTSQAPVQCPDLVRPRHANCR